MKDPREWDEQYLLNLPAGEFDWIDFKGRRGLDLSLPNVQEKHVLENLSKAISAFANSGGGVIVFGLKDPRPNQPLKVDDGGVNSSFKNGTREWLEDVIPHLVDYPLTTFNVYVVKKTSHSSQIAPGRDIFVVQVPDSEQAPHQAQDMKYYIRAGGKSVPIGHRLVMDIIGRRKHPILDLEFMVEEEYSLSSSGGYGYFGISSAYPNRQSVEPEPQRSVTLSVRARNNGSIYAQYVIAGIYLPISIIDPRYSILHTSSSGEEPKPVKLEDHDRTEYIDGKPYWSWATNVTLQGGGMKSRGLMGRAEYEPGWYKPILPTLSVPVLEVGLRSDLQATDLRADEKILWTIYADNSPERKGSTPLSEIPFVPSSETEE